MSYHFELRNVPPRTKSTKWLGVGTSPHDGNMTLTLSGGWSEYKPEQVEQIIAAMQTYLDELIRWECPRCFSPNITSPRKTNLFGHLDGYTWVRCQQCKKKTERSKLGLDN